MTRSPRRVGLGSGLKPPWSSVPGPFPLIPAAGRQLGLASGLRSTWSSSPRPFPFIAAAGRQLGLDEGSTTPWSYAGGRMQSPASGRSMTARSRARRLVGARPRLLHLALMAARVHVRIRANAIEKTDDGAWTVTCFVRGTHDGPFTVPGMDLPELEATGKECVMGEEKFTSLTRARTRAILSGRIG